MPTLKPNPATLNFTQHSRIPPKHIESLHAILTDSFPPSALGDFDTWVSHFDGRWLLYLAETEDKLLGFGSVRPKIADEVCLLEYLAVSLSYRNQNVGAGLLQHIAQSLRGRGDAEGMLIEVDSDDHGTDAETALRKRRIGFYKRNGAQLVECLPGLRTPNTTGGEPLHSKLMWLPLNANIEPPHGAKLRACLLGLYWFDYGLGEDDKLVQDALRGLVC